MSLEDYLSPLKFLDKQILKQYTKAGKGLKLDVGRRRYFISFILSLGGAILMGAATRKIGGATFHWGIWGLVCAIDGSYSLYGSIGMVKEEKNSSAIAIDPIRYFYKKYNSIVRLPTFLTGVGLVGMGAVDVYNYFTKGQPIEESRKEGYRFGWGLLSVASSMYIKEIDTKLLKEKPLYKKAYDWTKGKMSEVLTPVPQPAAIPVSSYKTIDGLVI